MSRQPLPNRRPAESFDVIFQGKSVQVTFGWTDDLRITEVFASTRKVGTDFDVSVRDSAIQTSLNLQYGVSPSILRRSLTMNERGEPEGFTGLIVHMIIEREAEVRSEAAA